MNLIALATLSLLAVGWRIDPIAQHIFSHALRQDFLPYKGPQESD